MEKGVCEICENQQSKYCCPKCDVLYCSLACYKDQKHLRCSEQFYKAAVIEELKEQNVDASAKEDMIRILKNLDHTSDFIDPHAECEKDELDSDDETEEDLADRLKGVNLNDGDAVWEKLTNEEQQQFQSLIETGAIIDLLPKKEPWYIKEDGFAMPQIIKIIPAYHQLSSKSPAKSVKFNLLNILAAYSYTQRYFMGDSTYFKDESCICLHNLSSSLLQNNNLQDVETAFKTIYIDGLSHQFEVDPNMETRILEDVRIILSEKNLVLASLSDMYRLFKSVDKQLEQKKIGKFLNKFQEHFRGSIESLDKHTRLIITKRLKYFLAYVTFYYESELVNLLSINV